MIALTAVILSHVFVSTCITGVNSCASNYSPFVIVLLTDKYAEIEKQLIDDFRRAYYDGDLQRMKNITAILSNFKVIFLNTCVILIHIVIHFNIQAC